MTDKDKLIVALSAALAGTSATLTATLTLLKVKGIISGKELKQLQSPPDDILADLINGYRKVLNDIENCVENSSK